MVEPADAYQTHNDRADPGSDVGEEAPDSADDVENDTFFFFSYVALDDVSVFEAAELDAIPPLADKQDNDLDPEVSVQLEQAKEQTYFPIGKEIGLVGEVSSCHRSSCMRLGFWRQIGWRHCAFAIVCQCPFRP